MSCLNVNNTIVKDPNCLPRVEGSYIFMKKLLFHQIEKRDVDDCAFYKPLNKTNLKAYVSGTKQYCGLR
ncbi:hypothetical protein NPIL_128881, partial [Nephila pilipes]